LKSIFTRCVRQEIVILFKETESYGVVSNLQLSDEMLFTEPGVCYVWRIYDFSDCAGRGADGARNLDCCPPWQAGPSLTVLQLAPLCRTPLPLALRLV
jgi:hypothetical protein